MNVISDDAEMVALYERIKNDDLAQRQRAKLSTASFETWLHDTFTKIALELGYTMKRISDFFKNMGYAFKVGFEEGYEKAKLEGELARERIKRRFK